VTLRPDEERCLSSADLAQTNATLRWVLDHQVSWPIVETLSLRVAFDTWILGEEPGLTVDEELANIWVE
jgi:hypothetical protein